MIDVDYKGDRFKITIGSRTIYLDYEDFDTLCAKCDHMHYDYLITKNKGETNE
tara:strand:+ start:4657 stop:4815 length:159 start_codon:yes stop_codon:yes gene_type:complete